MTLEQLKNTLPDVKVKIGKKTIPALLTGRKNRFASAKWFQDGTYLTTQVAWETVQHCVNNDLPITV